MVHTEEIKQKIGKDFEESVLQAKEDSTFKADPNGFIVIHVDKAKDQIVVEHYNYKRQIKHKITGKDAEALCKTIIKKDLISRLDHATYIGRELEKAQIALDNNLTYKQDKKLHI